VIKTVNIGLEISVLVILIGLLIMISAVPLPGVNNKDNITINNTQVKVELYDNSTINNNAVGLYETWNLLGVEVNKINLATKNRGLYHFMSVCSHEVIHAKLDIIDSRDLEQHHEKIKDEEFIGSIAPWNWEKECFTLLPSRAGF
jgi:hypothetical protein